MSDLTVVSIATREVAAMKKIHFWALLNTTQKNALFLPITASREI